MNHSAETTVGTNEYVVTDGNSCFIENRQVVIAYEILSNMYIRSEVAVKGTVYDEAFAYRMEDLLYNSMSLVDG